MDITISLIIIIICLVTLLFGIIKKAIDQKNEIKDLKFEIQKQEKVVAAFMKYVDKIKEITTDEKNISQKINEAESDEEISNIVSAIIHANNNRVQNG